MPLIKGVTAARATQRAVILDLGDLKREADRIVSQAQTEAAAIRARAAIQTQELIDGAAAEGYDEGYARGLAEGRDEGTKSGHADAHDERGAAIDTLTVGWRDALIAWEDAFAGMLASAEHDVLALAFGIAEKIIDRVIDRHPDVVCDQIRASLAHLSRPASLTIAIHPEDRPLVEATLPELLRYTQGCEHARLEDDAAITRGGCVVRTEHGRIDATIEKQMARIVDALLPGVAGGVTLKGADPPAGLAGLTEPPAATEPPESSEPPEPESPA